MLDNEVSLCEKHHVRHGMLQALSASLSLPPFLEFSAQGRKVIKCIRHQGSDPTRQQHGKERESTAKVGSHRCCLFYSSTTPGLAPSSAGTEPATHTWAGGPEARWLRRHTRRGQSGQEFLPKRSCVAFPSLQADVLASRHVTSHEPARRGGGPEGAEG